MGRLRLDAASTLTRKGLVASKPSTLDRPDVLPVPPSLGRGEWVVTVFDNDVNTYDQVITILMVATGCSADEAYIEAWEIDHLGSSVVHQGPEDECNRVANIVSTIGIQVEVSCE
jgi:hypothetical protein